MGLLSALTSNSLHSVSQSSIESEDAESSGEGEETPGVHLDTNVIIEPAATVEASRIGKGSSIDASAKVMKGAVLGERCKVAACCVVKEGEVLEAWTVVYGDGTLRRKERSGLEALRDAAHQKQLEVLRRLIPSNVGKWMS